MIDKNIIIWWGRHTPRDTLDLHHHITRPRQRFIGGHPDKCRQTWKEYSHRQVDRSRADTQTRTKEWRQVDTNFARLLTRRHKIQTSRHKEHKIDTTGRSRQQNRQMTTDKHTKSTKRKKVGIFCGFLLSPYRLMELTLGMLSWSQILSASSRSLISQANMVGFWRLYPAM